MATAHGCRFPDEACSTCERYTVDFVNALAYLIESDAGTLRALAESERAEDRRGVRGPAAAAAPAAEADAPAEADGPTCECSGFFPYLCAAACNPLGGERDG